MRRMHVCQVLFPDPLSGSMYTDWSIHSVRVGEEASVCVTTMCAPVCPYLSGRAGRHQCV